MNEQKRILLLSIIAILLGSLVYVISSLRGDYWMELFSFVAIWFNGGYLLYRYKDARMKAKLTMEKDR